MPSRLPRTLVSFLLAIVLVGMLLALAGWSQSLAAIYEASQTGLLWGLFFFVVATLLLGLGLYQALLASGANVSVRHTLGAHVAGLLLSDFTPARSGYVSVAAFLSQSSAIPPSQTLAAVFSVQSISFAFKFVMIVIAIPYLFLRVGITTNAAYSITIAGAISLLAAVALALFVWSARGVQILTRTYGIPLLGRMTRPIGSLLTQVHNRGAVIKRRKLVLVGACSVISSLSFAIALYPVGLSVGISNVSVLEWLLLGPLVAALGFVPITPGGLGAQEATYVAILGFIGVPLSTAVAFSLLARFLYIVPDLAGLPILLRAGILSLRANSQMSTR